MTGHRGRALVALVGACIVVAGCTLVLGDGKYAVVADAGIVAEAASPADASTIAPDTGTDDAGDAGVVDEASFDAGPCTAGARRCVADGVETCAPDGGWGAPATCATGTCAAGDCAGATTTAPSCGTTGDGRSTCGADGGESCCLSVEIPGGTYARSFASDGSQKSNLATISGFRLDKYLVTVGRFREFFSAWNASATQPAPATGAGKHVHLNDGHGLANSAASGKYETGWESSDDGYITLSHATSDLSCDSYATWTPSATGGHENLPVNCVNWYEAYAFCIWDGGFLPSEAEFEYAAAGGSAQHNYPWGSTAPGTENQYAIYGTGGSAPDCYYPSNGPEPCTGTTNLAPVGSAKLGAGLWGQLDLGGDVGEWDLDSYASYVVPCTDCANLSTSAAATAGRVVRGGGFKYVALNLETTERFAFPPVSDAGTPSNSDTWGVRCARVP